MNGGHYVRIPGDDLSYYASSPGALTAVARWSLVSNLQATFSCTISLGPPGHPRNPQPSPPFCAVRCTCAVSLDGSSVRSCLGLALLDYNDKTYSRRSHHGYFYAGPVAAMSAQYRLPGACLRSNGTTCCSASPAPTADT